MKKCSQCGEVKPYTEYHADGRGGLRTQCKPCENAQQAKWHAANKEQINAQRAGFRVKHKEQIRAADAAHYAANKEKINARHAGYRVEHREEISAQKAGYRDKHKEEARVYQAQYYQANKASRMDRVAARRRRHGRASPKTLQAMKVIRQRPCIYCGRKPGETGSTVDHVVPIAAGGRHHHANMVPACTNCNSSKGDRDLGEWLLWRMHMMRRNRRLSAKW